METKKIAFACFLGGVICSAFALMFTPTYWWLGLFAGLAGGYISYEFREFREAIPVAFWAARQGGASAWGNMTARARKWLSRPHPFFYPAAIVVAPLYAWGAYHLVPYLVNTHIITGTVEGSIFGVLILAGTIAAFIEATWLVIVPFALLAFIGARVGERCYWYPFSLPQSEEDAEKTATELEEKGLQRMPMTYRNVLRWTATGFGLTVLFFTYTIWKYLGLGVWKMLCLFGRFAWHLFRLVHSQKRVLCAIDGTLGGAAAYLWLASATMSGAEQMMLVGFGGLLGAAFGVANWEIVSKRLLRVTTSTS